MKIKTKIAALLLGATLAVSCTKSLDMNEQGNSELDWSRTSTITLNEVAMASSTRATDNLMEVNQTFRLYAIDPTTKDIIATRTYTIKGAAGKPVVDDLQKVIELPFGVVDIFLVGPVKATLNTVEHEIAGPTTVTPMRGVDLISSKTSVIVKSKETPIDPTPLQHRMVKLAIEVSMVKDVAGGDRATYQDALMTNDKHFIGIDNMGGMGTFAFDDQGGSVTSTPGIGYQYTYTAGNTGTGKIVQANPGEQVGTPEDGLTGAVYTVVDYVTPTVDTTPKLSVTYGYTRRDVGTKTEIVAHEMSGKTTAPQPWEGGTYVKISTTLIPSIDMTLRTEIKPWFDGGTTPVEPPVNNDLLFWYSGEDAPEVIDGKSCWRDRSGNGNHAVITGDMVYDNVNKCYYATTGNGSFIVPALGQVAEYTLELTAQTVLKAANNPAIFNGTDGKTGLSLHLPYDGQIVYNCPDQLQYEYTKSDKYIYEQLNSYAFCRNATTGAIVINGAEKQLWSNLNTWAPFDNNVLWINTRNVSPEKQRLYGAKLYKKYMNNAAGRNILVANHAAKLSQLGVTAPLSGTTFDYVKDGLIVDLQGTDALVSNQWQDRSGKGNHAQVFGSIVRNATSDGYTFPGNSGANYMKLVKSLGNVPHITFEIVTKSYDENRDYQQILVSAAQDNVLFPGVNIFEIWWAYGGKQALIDAPFSSDHWQRIWLPGSEMIYPTTTLSQLSLAKSTTNQITLRQNGYTYTDKIVTNNMAIPELKNVYLGAQYLYDQINAAYKGEIYAVRIYNRALSDFERQHNYLVDKAKYKILP